MIFPNILYVFHQHVLRISEIEKLHPLIFESSEIEVVLVLFFPFRSLSLDINKDVVGFGSIHNMTIEGLKI